jgi:ribosomal protein S19
MFAKTREHPEKVRSGDRSFRCTVIQLRTGRSDCVAGHSVLGVVLSASSWFSFLRSSGGKEKNTESVGGAGRRKGECRRQVRHSVSATVERKQSGGTSTVAVFCKLSPAPFPNRTRITVFLHFVGKLFWEVFVGKLFWEVFVGKLFWEVFVGKLFREVFVGKLFWQVFVGKLFWEVFVAKLFWEVFVGILLLWKS